MTPRPAQNDPVWELIDAACYSDPDAGQLRQLDRRLSEDPQACGLYNDYCQLHAALIFRAKNQESFEAFRSTFRNPQPSPYLEFLGSVYQGTISYFSQEVPFALLIGAVIVSLGLLAGSLISVTHYVQVANTTKTTPANPHLADTANHVYVARITGMADCKGAEVRGTDTKSKISNSQIPDRQSLVALGDRFVLSSGLLEITYDTGAKVILQGPCTYNVDACDSGFLSVGKLTARLEKRGKGREESKEKPSAVSGQRSEKVASETNPESRNPQISKSPAPSPATMFAVRTPTATVTDLGTEFGVVVQPSGEIQTIVYQGVVEVQQHTGDSATSTKRHVSAGQVAMTGKHGPLVIAAKNWENPVSFARTLQPLKTQEKPSDNHTIAYWRFEEGPADSSVPGQAMQGTHTESCVKDSSGNGNHLRAAQSGSSPIYRCNVSQGLALQSSPENRLSLEFGNGQNEPPCYLYSYDDSRFARSLNYHDFAKWTIEASVKIAKFDGKGYQTFVCRERYLDGIGYSSLYLQATPERKFSIRARQSDGAYIVVDGTTQVLTDTWYHVAGRSDGATLSLYVAEDGRDYRKENSLPFAGELFTGDRFWLVGQGVWSGKFVDQMHGFIDEVRISDAALDPAEFLFAGKRK